MALVDRQARRYFGMSGDEFIRAYRVGDLDDADHLKVMEVAMLLRNSDLIGPDGS
jgi:hypothetical protein